MLKNVNPLNNKKLQQAQAKKVVSPHFYNSYPQGAPQNVCSVFTEVLNEFKTPCKIETCPGLSSDRSNLSCGSTSTLKSKGSELDAENP